jgi:hypothetical protein
MGDPAVASIGPDTTSTRIRRKTGHGPTTPTNTPAVTMSPKAWTHP